MAILFCEKCGTIIKIEKIDGKKIAKCICGFEKQIEDNSEISATETVVKQPEIWKGAVSSKNKLATFPHECTKCGHDGAEVIDLGVWYGDEAGVIRYKCGKCGHTDQDKESNT